jgi:hypothetical protein
VLVQGCPRGIATGTAWLADRTRRLVFGTQIWFSFFFFPFCDCAYRDAEVRGMSSPSPSSSSSRLSETNEHRNLRRAGVSSRGLFVLPRPPWSHFGAGRQVARAHRYDWTISYHQSRSRRRACRKKDGLLLSRKTYRPKKSMWWWALCVAAATNRDDDLSGRVGRKTPVGRIRGDGRDPILRTDPLLPENDHCGVTRDKLPVPAVLLWTLHG